MRTLLAVLLAAGTATALTLPTGATIRIAVADGATAAEQCAAQELADYLAKATGAACELVAEGAAAAILVGPTAAARAAKLVPAGPEAWRCKLVGEQVVIAGGRPRGTLYGVYHFLEDVVGVHWWTPWAESVPSRPKIELAKLDLAGEPAFSYREIYDTIGAPNLWQGRNRMNGHHAFLPAERGGTLAYGPPYHVHTFFLYFPPEKHFAQHPEWYSEMAGRRQGERTQLCLTNPELTREMIAAVRANIVTSKAEAEAKGLPAPAVFSVSQNDWNNPCGCAKCQALAEAEGSEAGPLLNFVNQIADAVRDDFPWVYIDTLAYHYTLDPPKTIKPRDNVIIRLCDLTNPDQSQPVTHPNNQTFHDSVLAWSKIAKNLRIWDYAVTYGSQQGLPYPSVRTMAPDYVFFLEHSTTGMFIEHEYPVTADLWDLKMWVQMKLLENPRQDTGALIKTFTDGYYGAAGAKIREYLAALDEQATAHPARISAGASPASYTYLDLPFVVRQNATLDQAEAAVKGDPALLERVRHARLPLDRYAMYAWRDLCGQHLAAGGTKDTMPLDRQALAARCRSTWLREIERRVAKGRQPAEQAAAESTVSGLAALPGFVELPAQFRDLPRARVKDLLPDGFRLWADICKLTPDPASELGGAARLIVTEHKGDRQPEYLLNEKQPMPWGVYDTVARKGLKSTNIKADQVPGPGYHLYKLEDVKLTAGCYAYFFWSWIIQCDVPVTETDARWDLYASIKFDGPGFPHGDPKAENSIWVERLLLVKREP